MTVQFRTSPKSSAATANLTNGLAIRVMALDSYPVSAPGAVVAYGSRCRCGLEASNTDRRTLKIPQSCVGSDSTADSVTDEVATAGVAETGCYCIVIKQLTLVLKKTISISLSKVRNGNKPDI